MAKRYVYELWSVTVDGNTITQGSQSYGYVFTNVYGAYSTGYNTTGDLSDYWVNYVGSDTIDPVVNVSVSNGVVTSTIVPAAGNVYGGEISYIIERKINDYPYWSTLYDRTTQLTLQETVQTNMVTYQTRVVAVCKTQVPTLSSDDDIRGGYVLSEKVEFPQEGDRFVWMVYSALGGTLQETVTSSSIDTYPLDNVASSGKYYEYVGCDSISPTALAYSGTAYGGEVLTLILAANEGNVYGGTVTYRYQITEDGGSTWTTLAETVSVTTALTLSTEVEVLQARVQALDEYGYEGEWVYASELEITQNQAPVITCDVTDMGEVTEGFSISYTVTDADGGYLVVKERVDGDISVGGVTHIGSSTVYKTATISAAVFLALENGVHTLEITATDKYGKSSTHVITFTKAVTTCTITWEEAKATASVIKRVYANYVGRITAEQATLLVSNDSGASWEDMTEAFFAGETYSFQNTTATSPGFNFKLTCEENGAGGGYIDAIGFAIGSGDTSEYGNTVATLTHVKTGGVHTLTGLSGWNGLVQCVFKSTDSCASGESVEIDGESYTVNTVSGAAVSWANGVCVSCAVDVDNAVMTVQI